MLCKGAPIVIKLSNVNDATIASVVTDAPGGICEGMMLSIQPIVEVTTRNPKGMILCVKGDSGSGVIAQSQWFEPSMAPLPTKKRTKDEDPPITAREFLDKIEKKVGLDALQAYYATEEFKIKVQEAVAEKVKELEPEIRKRLK